MHATCENKYGAEAAFARNTQELIQFFHTVVLLEENSAKEYQKGSRSFEHLRELTPFGRLCFLHMNALLQ